MSIAEKIGPRPATRELQKGGASAGKREVPSLDISSLTVTSVQTKKRETHAKGSVNDNDSCIGICSQAVCTYNDCGRVQTLSSSNRFSLGSDQKSEVGVVMTLQRRDGTGSALQLGEFRVGAANAGGSSEAAGRTLTLEVNSLNTSRERGASAQVSAGTEDECTFAGDNCSGPTCNFAERFLCSR